MRRFLAPLAAVTLGAAIVLPTVAAAPAATPDESIQPIGTAQPVESARSPESAEPGQSAQPSEVSEPTESQPRAPTQPAAMAPSAGLWVEQIAVIGEYGYEEDFLVLSGTSVTWSIWVYNIGAVPLHDITIDSDFADLTDTDCADPPDLEPRTEQSESKNTWLFNCEYKTVAQEGTTRHATTADSRETDPQTSGLTIYAYAEWPLTVTLTNDAPVDAHGRPTAKAGDIVTFTVNYTITGVTAPSGLLFAVLGPCQSYVDGSATNNDEFVFEGVRTVEGEPQPTWVADGVTKSGSVTYRVKIETCAADWADEADEPLWALAYVDLALGWGWLYDDSSIYVEQAGRARDVAANCAADRYHRFDERDVPATIAKPSHLRLIWASPSGARTHPRNASPRGRTCGCAICSRPTLHGRCCPGATHQVTGP